VMIVLSSDSSQLLIGEYLVRAAIIKSVPTPH